MKKKVTEGRWAVVTGASRGIGFHLAAGLVGRGYGVVIVARDEQRLERAREELTGLGGEVVALRMDLSEQGAAQRLHAECQERGLEVEVLVNNAGMFAYRDLADCSAERVGQMVRLNVAATTELCRLFVGDMRARGRGYILNMSSYASWLPMAGLGLYGASKSYLRELSYALRDEVRESGVSVTVALPAGVATELYGLGERYRRLGVRLGVLGRPERVADRALRGLFAGRRRVGPGVMYRMIVPLLRHLPRYIKVAVRKKTLGFQK